MSEVFGPFDYRRIARLERWGRHVLPGWIFGDEVIAPAADTKLVSHSVSVGREGYIYGFEITAGETNDFKINWVSGGVSKSRRIIFGGKGTLHHIDFIAFNEKFPADAESEISITNINNGSGGVAYQTSLLIAEV